MAPDEVVSAAGVCDVTMTVSFVYGWGGDGDKFKCLAKRSRSVIC